MTVTTLKATTPRRRTLSTGAIFGWIALILMLVITLLPLWWVVRTSLSTNRELYANPSVPWPVGFTFDNFARVLGQLDTSKAVAAGGSGQSLNFWLYLRNSVIVSGIQVGFHNFIRHGFQNLHGHREIYH